jgi:DNA-binding transcriptional LysR family regulator
MLSERLDAFTQCALLAFVDPAPVDAGLDEKLRLAMVIDVLDVDRDGRVVGPPGRRLSHDARTAPGGKRDIALSEDRDRYPGALAQACQRPAAAVQAKQDAAIPGAHGGRDRDRVGAPIDGGEHGDRPGGPLGERLELRVLAVAEEGQFTRAATRVSVAQPAVSAQIRRLERELGEPLFHRDQRRVRLSIAGEALLPHARAALDAAQRGRDTIASLRGVLHGRLRIGVSGPVDHRFAETLGDFHRAHPAVEISVTQQHNEPLLEAVANGDMDAAVVGVGAQSLPPQVGARVVAVEPLVLAVRRDHPLSSRRTVTLAQLGEQPMITLVRGSGLRTLLENACRDAGFVPWITAEAGELGSLVELAVEGLGAAVLPSSAADGADLAVLKITRPRLRRRTALAWNETVTSPAGQAFLALADRRFN